MRTTRALVQPPACRMMPLIGDGAYLTRLFRLLLQNASLVLNLPWYWYHDTLQGGSHASIADFCRIVYRFEMQSPIEADPGQRPLVYIRECPAAYHLQHVKRRMRQTVYTIVPSFISFPFV